MFPADLYTYFSLIVPVGSSVIPLPGKSWTPFVVLLPSWVYLKSLLNLKPNKTDKASMFRKSFLSHSLCLSSDSVTPYYLGSCLTYNIYFPYFLFFLIMQVYPSSLMTVIGKRALVTFLWTWKLDTIPKTSLQLKYVCLT